MRELLDPKKFLGYESRSGEGSIRVKEGEPNFSFFLNYLQTAIFFVLLFLRRTVRHEGAECIRGRLFSQRLWFFILLFIGAPQISLQKLPCQILTA